MEPKATQYRYEASKDQMRDISNVHFGFRTRTFHFWAKHFFIVKTNFMNDFVTHM